MNKDYNVVSSNRSLKAFCFQTVVGMLALLLLSPAVVSAQASRAQGDLAKAQEMFELVWKDYRKPQYGLFAEHYPFGKADSLTYMQGGQVQEKQVSFLWPFSGMFSATNALIKFPEFRKSHSTLLDTITAGMEKYLDKKRTPAGYQAFPVAFEKSDRYYDDNGLVGIEYMEAYFNTHNPVYLQRAKTVFRFIISGWDEKLGGGVTWLEGHHDQKPACSNGMDMLVALKLYQATHDKSYLNWGTKFYNWMYTHLRDSTTGIYSNDEKADGHVNRTFYSYNSGSMIEGATLLYHFTHNTAYLQQAQLLAKNTFQYFHTQPHDSHLNLKIDLPWFLTVLFRGYDALYRIDKNPVYINAIRHDLNYAWAQAKDRHGLITASWTPRQEELDKPKWLLDEACIAELYARLALLEMINTNSLSKESAPN